VTSFFLAPPAVADPTQGSPTDKLFNADDFARAAAYFTAHPELAPTSLTPLPALARRLGVGHVLVKNETARFGLPAFKPLGARFAIEQLLAEGRIAKGDTLVCASEGNHGRAVAHAARLLGCQARVYLSESVAAPRADAIASEGATLVRVPGTYDDAVRAAAEEATSHSWTVVSDTSWSGYEHIPWLIMLGYTRLVDEMAEAMPDGWRPDAIFVPGGVGGLLAAVGAACTHRWPARPRLVAVEPVSAACLQASARAGVPTVVPGPFDTMMGGLRCGEVSPLAFRAVLRLVDAYIGIDDSWAARAMRMLARPAGDDLSLAVGPSGAAALAGLLAFLEDEAARNLRAALAIGAGSSVVLIASEGATDPPLWARIVGQAGAA